MFGFFVAIVALALQIASDAACVNGLDAKAVAVHGGEQVGGQSTGEEKRSRNRSKRTVNQASRREAFGRNVKRVTRYGERTDDGW